MHTDYFTGGLFAVQSAGIFVLMAFEAWAFWKPLAREQQT